jgi:hypothetical protein
MRSKLVVLLAALGAAACAPAPERLTLQGRTLSVYNDSGERWTGVEIWVNDHYRVTREAIEPGERFVVPLESFVAGFGQRFAPGERVSGVEVTATDASGDPVRVAWGSGRRR